MFVARWAGSYVGFLRFLGLLISFNGGFLRFLGLLIGFIGYSYWVRTTWAGGDYIQKKTGPQRDPAFFVGGVDGTRTRDPRRDRPVF